MKYIEHKNKSNFAKNDFLLCQDLNCIPLDKKQRTNQLDGAACQMFFFLICPILTDFCQQYKCKAACHLME
jgi:hypothetical protein